jgi:hypothetical protein
MRLNVSTPVLPEVLHLRAASPQVSVALATEDGQRLVWEGRFGSMLIEVVEGVAYVNGERVEPVGAMDPPAAQASRF